MALSEWTRVIEGYSTDEVGAKDLLMNRNHRTMFTV